MASRKLVRGWGINDADYTLESRDKEGKRIECPIYRCWKHMIQRCYCPKYQAKQQTYIGCWIDERWRRFMMFRAWYLDQNPKLGEHLDKDFLGDGKLYSPETCCFVPQWLNKLFNNHGAKRGPWPQGVSFNKRDRKYQALINIRGKKTRLGDFNIPEEASAVYLKAKAVYVEELLMEFPQPPRLVDGVRREMTELIEQEQRLWHASLKP